MTGEKLQRAIEQQHVDGIAQGLLAVYNREIGRTEGERAFAVQYLTTEAVNHRLRQKFGPADLSLIRIVRTVE